MENEKTEKKTHYFNPNAKSNLAIILSVIAIGFSLYGGGVVKKEVATGPDAFIKNSAKEVGMSGRSYDKCIEDPSMRRLIDEDVQETNAIVNAEQLNGIGTPFNLIVSDTQVIPVSGAYPYEFFDLIINEINEKGVVSDEILNQFEITAFKPETRELFRPYSTEYDHYRGSENPSIAIIEYSDLECPYCSRIHPTLERIVAEHENVGWAYRHLPLNFHEQAMPAAIASECVAREEGNEAFGQFVDTIFSNQDKLQK